MYILLFGIHSLFIITCHLLGYYILEGIFLLFLLFFLLYFSPIFFLKKEAPFQGLQFPSFSLQNSITTPMILVYTALYLFLFALTGSIGNTLHLHIYILIGAHIIFFGYMMSFVWKHDIFFDIVRFHLVLTYITIFLSAIFGWFYKDFFSFPLLGISVATIILSFIVFFVSREEHTILFQNFLAIIIFTGYLCIYFITGLYSFPFFVSFVGIFSIILFEFMPRYRFFSQFLEPAKTFTLLLSIISVILLLGWSFYDFMTLYPVMILCIFFFSVHIRYSNYIAYGLAIFSLLFIYSKVFFGMIDTKSFFSTLLFVFFLPSIIIGTTYLWKKTYPYDFLVLHYSSIVFSGIFSLYVIFFLGWGEGLLYMVSSCIFLIGVLLFLSYFRLRFD